MGITVFKDSSDSTRTYLRITRAINGREQQRYVRVEGASKSAMKRAMKEAKEIDQRLEQWQSAVRQLMMLKGDTLIHEDGTILGLQLQTRHREGRKPATEFKLRVKLPGRKPLFKSVSVDKHGFEKAFELSVKRICELRGITEDSEAYGKMLMCIDAYKEKYDLPPGLSEATAMHLDREDSPEKAANEKGWLDQISGWFKR
ncbi:MULTISPECIES: hypothetical protein [Hahella]|uniref:Uncharacterized protein n=1 Tax=Hahella chejuensis (strain KCTC 2396) TaxID=349521 RepID=Q2S7Q1_HAHCH|nr:MULTISPECIES: hypothetical protein [Hahella]ABC33323.1 hypothetical protein HCH_06694 [Hahella chejuensis KCTC 2396]AZZ95080.1 hypothetical protein ENC22_29325 [Hahella sp. KA22]MBU6951065.1 hypothetical protein [Hahella sp. HN01]MDG9666795.1 hypothetical protein [Hahella sp. CR1]QAY52725.1 hypothetical protein EUZ85_01035 [Hahella sp. KA22]